MFLSSYKGESLDVTIHVDAGKVSVNQPGAKLESHCSLPCCQSWNLVEMYGPRKTQAVKRCDHYGYRDFYECRWAGNDLLLSQ